MIFKNVAAKIRIINVKGKGRYKICKKAIEANKFWSDLEELALGKKKRRKVCIQYFAALRAVG